MRHIIVCGFWFVDYYECTNNYFRTIKCIGSSSNENRKKCLTIGAQEDMMAEQGLLGICWNGKERSQVWDNVFTGKAASIKTFKTVQVPYSLWDVTKVGLWDTWWYKHVIYCQSQDAQDMHTYKFCARVLTKWNLIFQCSQDMHTYKFCARSNNKVDIVFPVFSRYAHIWVLCENINKGYIIIHH